MSGQMNDRERGAYRKQLIQWLSAGYVFALLVVGSVAGTAHILTGHVIDAQSTSAAVVNVSGRQRMLSQRIALLAYDWQDGKDADAFRKLDAAVDLFATSHEQLVGRTPSDFEDNPSEAIRAVYFDPPHNLDQRSKQLVERTRAVLAGGASDKAAVIALADFATHDVTDGHTLLESLNAAVTAFETHHRDQIAELKMLQKVALTVLIITLLLEGVFIHRPLVARVRMLMQALSDAALTDALTDVNNRRGFEMLARTLLLQRRRGAVLIFDIDHFKQVNDTLGHAAGDLCIQHVADRARAAVRDGDVLGRIGGEEFAMVLIGGDTEHALIVAERIRRSVEYTPCPLDGLGLDVDYCNMTISVGVKTFEADGEEDLATLLEQADSALYAAKRGGRNRVVVAGSVEDVPVALDSEPSVKTA
ncbi:MAG: diguanylate cyclase [Pseudomonadota bacterium]